MTKQLIVVGGGVRSGKSSFALARADWDRVISDVLGRLETFARPDLSRSAFRTVAFTADVPAAYNNSVLIAAADAARRRGWHDLAEGCVEACTNPALSFLWSRWRVRTENARTAATKANAVASSG